MIALMVNGLVATDKITMLTFPLTIDLSALTFLLQYSAFFILLVISIGVLIVLVRDRNSAIDSLKSLIGSHEPDNNSFRKFLMVIAVFLVVFVVVLLVTRVGIEGLQSSISEGNGQSSGGSQPSTPTDLTTPQFPLTLSVALGVAILAIILACSLLAFQAMREIRAEAKLPLKDEPVLEEKALNVVKETISSIVHEGDFRTAIIRCYQRLCDLLVRYNCPIEKHQTVQEFKTVASKALNIPEKPFARLTQLFEEARYSLHEMDETKKNDALKFLTEIGDHLSSGR